MPHHVRSSRSQSSSTEPRGGPSRTRCLTMVHRCSMGFRSGDWAGQARECGHVVRLQSPLRAAARVLRVVVLLQGKVRASARQEPRRRGQHMPFQDPGVYGTSHSDEDTALIFDPIFTDMHPQSKMEPPPNSLLGITDRVHSGWGSRSLQHHARPCALTSSSFVSSGIGRCASHSRSSGDEPAPTPAVGTCATS